MDLTFSSHIVIIKRVLIRTDRWCPSEAIDGCVVVSGVQGARIRVQEVSSAPCYVPLQASDPLISREKATALCPSRGCWETAELMEREKKVPGKAEFSAQTNCILLYFEKFILCA